MNIFDDHREERRTATEQPTVSNEIGEGHADRGVEEIVLHTGYVNPGWELIYYNAVILKTEDIRMT